MFTVHVHTYQLSPTVDPTVSGEVYSSVHRSPHAAARKLASLITERTAFAKTVRRSIPRGQSGRYLIETDGKLFSLADFRSKYC